MALPPLLIARGYAPFPIETGEECISTFERFHDLRIARTGYGPSSAASEEASFVGKIRCAATIDHSMETDNSMFESIPKEMIENIFGCFRVTADLHDL